MSEEQAVVNTEQSAVVQNPEGDRATDGNQVVQPVEDPIDQTRYRQDEQNPDLLVRTVIPGREDDDRTCFVGNIGPKYIESDLETIFSAVAKPTYVRVVRHPDGRSKGVAFIEFETREIAQKAIDYFSKESIEGRIFHMKFASDPLSPPTKNGRKVYNENPYNKPPYGPGYKQSIEKYYRERQQMRDDRYGPPPPRDYRDDRMRRGDRYGLPPPPPPRDRRYERRYDDRDYYRDERRYDERRYDDRGRYERRYDPYDRDSRDRGYYSGQSRDYRSSSSYGYDSYGHSSSSSSSIVGSSVYGGVSAATSLLSQVPYPSDLPQMYMVNGIGGTSSDSKSSVSFPEPK